MKNEPMQFTVFLHAGTTSCKLAWSKIGMAIHVIGLKNRLYLKNEQMEGTDFFHVDTDSQKLKAYQKFYCVGMDKNECGQ